MSNHYWARRRRPTRFAVLVMIVGLATVMLLQWWPNRHSIEDKLTTRSTAALNRAGITGAQVDFTGRDGRIVVAKQADVERAKAIVGQLDGVRVVLATAGDTAPPPTSPAPEQPAITITINAGQAVVTGAVPSEAARNALINGVSAAIGTGSVEDRLAVDPARAGGGLAGLPAIVGALGPAAGATILLSGGVVTLTGTVATPAAKANTATAAAAAIGAGNVHDQLTVVPSPQTVEQQLSALPRITFESDSATLTTAGRAALSQVAAILTASPTVKIRIEGHTDGTGTVAWNQVLSEARADTVRATLIALGVSADQLTTAGYGETRPLVPDNTAANQAINRRVEFVVLG
jgi:outer membrane protein OmpA-like peptidoglycan-associated protein